MFNIIFLIYQCKYFTVRMTMTMIKPMLMSMIMIMIIIPVLEILFRYWLLQDIPILQQYILTQCGDTQQKTNCRKDFQERDKNI